MNLTRLPLYFSACLLPLVTVSSAAAPAPAIVERGPHHKIVRTVASQVMPWGQEVFLTNHYVELATGMHYQKDGQWHESREEIELFEGGAVARQGAHQVIFAPDIATPGVIDVQTPDGRRFRSHVLGLAYTDATSGQSVLIAEIQTAVGEVAGNQVLYRDAFTDLQADVRYTWTRAGLEQDILLRQAPPPPGDYDMDPASTRLEVFTEFLESPEPVKTRVVLKTEPDPVKRAAMVLPEFADETLEFGAMSIGPGRAFPLRDQPVDALEAAQAEVLVGKSWEHIEGRTFLIEAVEYLAAAPQLQQLPLAAVVRPQRREQIAALAPKAIAKGAGPAVANASPLPKPARPFPPPPRPRDRAKEAMRAAALAPTPPGLAGQAFVLDYVLASSATNFVFRGDTTYLVSSLVNLSDTTTIEGGTVVKFTNSAGGNTAKLYFQGPIVCKTTPYHPAIFTAKDDDTVGNIIAGSTGTPSGYYGEHYLSLAFTAYTGGGMKLHDVILKYAAIGTHMPQGREVNVDHAQLIACDYGLFNKELLIARNVLSYKTRRVFGGPFTNAVTRASHLTVHQAEWLVYGTSLPPVLLTNSLLLAVTNNVSYSGANVVSNLNASGFLQTVGGGAHYLAAGSTNRNAGTTNIETALLAELKQRTTYPPVLLTNHLSNDLTFSPQAQRDTDTPDLGYHYPVLDFLMDGVALQGGTLLLTNGAVLGLACTRTNFGLSLQAGQILSQGSPLLTNRLLSADAVQETASSSSGGSHILIHNHALGSNRPEARFRFTEFPLLAGELLLFTTPTTLEVFELTHCAVLGGILPLRYYGNANRIAALTNTLLERVDIEVYASQPMTFHAYNCLFKDGQLEMINGSTDSFFLRDNVFDGVTLTANPAVGNSHNAYVNGTSELLSSGPNWTFTTLAYQAGLLGGYYLPATVGGTNNPILNAGSRNATNTLLYHFTTGTNQVKETNTTVDLGLHYVAVNASGQPIGSDSDALADYFEDANGNGEKDASETGWQDEDSDNDDVDDFLERLLGRNPFIVGTTNDAGGLVNLRIYTPLK